MLEDEKLSPSFENAIVLWTLHKIDPRLPARVKKNYGYQMTGNTTLKDVQPVIFENIDVMLEELDQVQTTKAFAMQSLDDETTLNAIRYQSRNNTRGTRPFSYRGRGGNRGGFGGGRGGPGGGRGGGQGGRGGGGNRGRGGMM